MLATFEGRQAHVDQIEYAVRVQEYGERVLPEFLEQHAWAELQLLLQNQEVPVDLLEIGNLP